MPTDTEKKEWLDGIEKAQEMLRSIADEIAKSDLPVQSFSDPMNKHNLILQSVSGINMAENIKSILNPPKPLKL